MDRDEGGLVVMGRAEIDTRSPFRSVKEAVSIFGERVLAGEIYAKQLKEMRATASESGQNARSKIQALTAGLEGTKASLEKAREENNVMAYCMKSLKEELEQTKKELQRLKARELYQKQVVVDPEIEDIKFVENATSKTMKNLSREPVEYHHDHRDFQKKSYVKFASPPELAKVIVTKEEMLERPPSVKKPAKRKSLIPILGWLFAKKKANPDEHVDSPEIDGRIQDSYNFWDTIGICVPRSP